MISKNRLFLSIVFSFLIALLFLGQSLCLAEDQSVTVTGKADMVGNNSDAAQKKALSDAFRNAVEKGLGVWIKSQTEVKDSTMVRDEILTKAEGYVIDHEIVKEGVQNNFYYVTIKARVALDKIGADFNTLVGRVSTQMGNPSIAFVLTTWAKIGAKGSYGQTDSVDVAAKKRETGSIEGGISESSASESNRSAALKEKASVSGSQRQSSSVSAAGNQMQSSSASVAGSGSGSFSGNANRSIQSNDDSDSANVNVSGSANYAGKANVRSSDTYSGSANANSAYSGSAKSNNSYSGSAKTKASDSQSYNVKGAIDQSSSTNASLKVAKAGSYEKIDEKLWKKYPDATIFDSFQQEFLNRNFDLKAADKAREIALTESLSKTSVDPNDRRAVREQAEKEGANFVARGEVKILDSKISENTGRYVIAAQIGAEIIDVNSGDIVASYTNTYKATDSSEEVATGQAIKKIAAEAAKTLANQTIATWQKRSLSGRQYTIEIRNITNRRKQQRPFLDAITAVAQITNQTTPENGVLMVTVLYKGEKNDLDKSIMKILDSKPGFSADDLDDPAYEGGKLIFKFLK